MHKETKSLTKIEPESIDKDPRPLSIKSLKSDPIVLGISTSLIATLIYVFLTTSFWPLALGLAPLIGIVVYQRLRLHAIQKRWNARQNEVGETFRNLLGEREEQHKKLEEEVEELKEWKAIAGITGLVGCVQKLQGSGYHPKECMENKVDRWLDFMGHGASKWNAERGLMERMLKRISEGFGQARFLILDPESEACKETSIIHHKNEFSDAQVIIDSLLEFKQLRNAYGKYLDVRLYEHRPELRLTFIDKSKVIVGHYRANKEDSKDSPLHVYVTKKGDEVIEWSFYTAFLIHFEEEWERAKQVDWNRLEELKTQYSSK